MPGPQPSHSRDPPGFLSTNMATRHNPGPGMLQSVFCPAARRPPRGKGPSLLRRAGGQKTHWTEPLDRCSAMGFVSRAGTVTSRWTRPRPSTGPRRRTWPRAERRKQGREPGSLVGVKGGGANPDGRRDSRGERDAGSAVQGGPTSGQDVSNGRTGGRTRRASCSTTRMASAWQFGQTRKETWVSASWWSR